jgi:hypothetical protein
MWIPIALTTLALALSACAPLMLGAVAGMGFEAATGVGGNLYNQAVDQFDGDAE